MIFNGVLLLACLREIYRGRGNRIVAAGMGLIFLVAILMSNGIDIARHFFATSQFVSALAVGVMLIKRAWDAWNESNRLRGEVAAAREVQQVLVPADVPAIPGFLFESVYKPAGAVGGDFFQVMLADNGGSLVVIGDVSGKGMPAAMTVSLLVGTVRTLAHYTQSPGEILAAMNQRMLTRSRGGFTTCLVIHVSPDGSLTGANAGHLAPYLNGRELEIENGLPLGLAPDAAYAESKLLIEPGDQLTLLTDGVIEARSPAGELLGFERTRALSVQPAEKVAEAAQAFGQEDDITVLTLKFAGAVMGVRGD
jgi:serine phosphatase RsbU (regulator of sigma subunit)